MRRRAAAEAWRAAGGREGRNEGMKGGRRVRVRAWALVRFPAAPRSLARPGGGTVPGGGGGRVGGGSPPSRRHRRRGWGGRARPPAPFSDTYLQEKECFSGKA